MILNLYINILLAFLRQNCSRLMAALFLILFVVTANAQGIRSNVEVDTNDILIGDHINLSIFVNSPLKSQIIWPLFEDTLTQDIEILQKSMLDTVGNGEENAYSQRLLLTIFDSGFYYIPPIRFYYNVPGDTNLYYFESDPIPITVNTMEVDTSKVIKDIKAPLEAPITFKEVLPWILGGIAVILIAWLIRYYLRRRKQAKPLFQIKVKPKIPPHKKALEALEKLKEEKLWQSGLEKAYHSKLTDIVRVYLEERFNIMAVEMTSAEIIDSLKTVNLEKQSEDKLNQILILADFVKFAKLKPLPLEHDQSFNSSLEFVKETMLKTTEKAEGNMANSNDGVSGDVDLGNNK